MQVFYPTEFHISTADSHEISSSNVQLNLQLQIIKSQQDNQEKGLASLNSKLESAGYGLGLTVAIFAGSGNIVQVLKYFDDSRELQKKEEQEKLAKKELEKDKLKKK